MPVSTTAKPVRVKPVEEKQQNNSFYESLSDSLLVEQYIRYKEKSKQLDESIAKMQEVIKSRMKDDQLVTHSGAIVRSIRRSYTWTMEHVKDTMGRNWSNFVQPDQGLLKERMKTKDAIGVALELGAVVKTSEALIVKEVE